MKNIKEAHFVMIQLNDISKKYLTSEIETSALSNISLSVSAGEFVAVMGPSGCGKSTLLSIIGLLDSPSSGSYRFMDKEVSKMTEKNLSQLRRASFGFVFQGFNLIDELTVSENIEVALIYRKVSSGERKHKVAEVLEKVGMEHRARHFPSQLSGGQQQRVAIARAIVSSPKIILADEPTGNLDTTNGNEILELLSSASRSGTTVLMVTHSPVHASRADRIINMIDGKLA
jgi:putative ABC transport system ATP-binding protein